MTKASEMFLDLRDIGINVTLKDLDRLMEVEVKKKMIVEINLLITSLRQDREYLINNVKKECKTCKGLTEIYGNVVNLLFIKIDELKKEIKEEMENVSN